MQECIESNRVNSRKAKTRVFTRDTSTHRWTAHLTGDICGTYLVYLKRKARERGLAFDVDAEYLWNLFLQQNKRCALSGVELHISNKIDKHNNIDRSLHTASLDRIDNTLPYIEGNLQWVHKQINQMRRQYSVEEYVHWCSLVSSHANLEPSVAKGNKVATKVQRLTGEEPTNNPDTSALHPDRMMI